MKANYTTDKAGTRTLIETLAKLNILHYAEYFNCKAKAAHNFSLGLEKNCKEYLTDYAGYGHDYAVARDAEKSGISVDLKPVICFPVYWTNLNRIKFYLNLTAVYLLDKGKSKASVQRYIDSYVAKLSEKQWTDGKARKELDRELSEKLNVRIV